MDINHIYKNGSFEELQEVTSLRENQLYWIDYIVSSMEKRRVAEILFLRGYTVKEVEDVLVLADGEGSLIKDHLNKYGTIDTKSILNTLNNIYRREALEAAIERLINKKYDKNVIEEVIELFRD